MASGERLAFNEARARVIQRAVEAVADRGRDGHVLSELLCQVR
jgi:hypothetical protein